jgi:hypothetical protein
VRNDALCFAHPTSVMAGLGPAIHVIPAQAGIQRREAPLKSGLASVKGCVQFSFAPTGASWIPAFAGMTQESLIPASLPCTKLPAPRPTKGALMRRREAGRGAAPAGLGRNETLGRHRGSARAH